MANCYVLTGIFVTKLPAWKLVAKDADLGTFSKSAKVTPPRTKDTSTCRHGKTGGWVVNSRNSKVHIPLRVMGKQQLKDQKTSKNPTEWGLVSLSCSFHCQILSRCLNVWSWHTQTRTDLSFHKHHSPFPTLIILLGWLDNGKTDTAIRVTENPQCRMPCIIGHGTGWTGCCFCFLRMEDILVVNQEGTHICCIIIWKHFRRTTWI